MHEHQKLEILKFQKVDNFLIGKYFPTAIVVIDCDKNQDKFLTEE